MKRLFFFSYRFISNFLLAVLYWTRDILLCHSYPTIYWLNISIDIWMLDIHGIEIFRYGYIRINMDAIFLGPFSTPYNHSNQKIVHTVAHWSIDTELQTHTRVTYLNKQTTKPKSFIFPHCSAIVLKSSNVWWVSFFWFLLWWDEDELRAVLYW